VHSIFPGFAPVGGRDANRSFWIGLLPRPAALEAAFTAEARIQSRSELLTPNELPDLPRGAVAAQRACETIDRVDAVMTVSAALSIVQVGALLVTVGQVRGVNRLASAHVLSRAPAEFVEDRPTVSALEAAIAGTHRVGKALIIVAVSKRRHLLRKAAASSI